MIRFRLIFSVLLFVVAFFSAQSNAAGADKANWVQSFVAHESLIDLNSEHSIKIQLFDKAESVKHVSHEQNSSGFEPAYFRLVVSNSSLFLNQVQVEPNYTPVFEFFTPSLAKELFLQPLEPPIRQPWYIAYEGKKTRLSGWKDANLLYRAINTYHS